MIKRLRAAAAIALVSSVVLLVPAMSRSTSESRVPQSTAGSDASPPSAEDGTPDATPTCKPGTPGVRFGTNRGETLKDYQPNEIICARGGNDRVEVRFIGTKVYSGPGVDTINSRQATPQIPNEIWGGEGRDTATVDRWDNWKGVESLRSTSGGPALSERKAVTYPAVQPRIRCQIANGQRQLIFDSTPQLRAVDSTPRVDWQSVAWSPVLSYYNAQTQQWEFVAQNEWLWDRTYDQQISNFEGNVWRRFSTGAKWHLWFFANYPNLFFKVAVYYYHYAEGSVPANRVYAWVDQYVGDYATRDGASCYFPS